MADRKTAHRGRTKLRENNLSRTEAADIAEALTSYVVENKLREGSLSPAHRHQLETLIADSITQNMMDLSELHEPAQSLAHFLGKMYARVQIGQSRGLFKHYSEPRRKKVAKDFSERFFSEFMRKAYEIATTFSIDLPGSAGSPGSDEIIAGKAPGPAQKPKAQKFAIKKSQPTLKFKDIGGNAEAKKELSRFVAFFTSPSRFRQVGAKLPKGILLKGPHGAGKPSLVMAMAGEAGVGLVKIDATDLAAMYSELGSEGMVRAIETVKGDSPLIILIDEILPAQLTGQDYAAVALRVLFNGFAKAEDVLIIGATSNPESPDPALLRHDRFGRVLPVDKPDLKARLEILRIYTTSNRKTLARNPRKKLVQKRLDLAKWARDTAGFTPERMENLLNDAAMLAAGKGPRKMIGEEEMQGALDRIVEGAGSTHRLTDREKEIVAVHELGHALVSHYLPNASHIAKISIVGKGEQLGYTRPYQREGRYLMSRDMLLDGVATLMGGRLAEELIYPENEKTDGSSSDLQVLTDLMLFAVTEIGFGNGYVLPDKEHDRKYLRRQVDLMVREAESRALNVLTSHYYELFMLKDILVKKESIDGKEFREILRSIEAKKNKLSKRQLEREIQKLETGHAKKLSKVITKASFLVPIGRMARRDMTS
ncbi:MAG: AAA family ATPase [Candidatus Eiseniibacteriota bacterium]|nr:MAG: AAA family ATPase [Candidatus Eisenbacteria bacterium]